MEQVGVEELMRDVLPKLQATRHLVDSTLSESIAACKDDEGEHERLIKLQDEFTLQMTMIRLNLDHLLKRCSEQLKAAAEGCESSKSLLIALDEAESVAIESAKRLYRRAQELQTR